MLHLANAWWLLALPLPLIAWLAFARQRRGSTLAAYRHPYAQLIKELADQRYARPQAIPWLWLVGCMVLVVAAARPQWLTFDTRDPRLGHDIMLAIDLSASMRAEDFLLNERLTNRFEVTQHFVRRFIEERSSDRIGIVIFGDDAYTLSPPTTDHQLLLSLLDEVQIGMAGEQTALGNALALAVDQLARSTSPQRYLVIFTDGANTSGSVYPLHAAEAATTAQVSIYSVGIGKQGKVLFPSGANAALQLEQLAFDESMLRQLAAATGGRYFSAQDSTAFSAVVDEIDRLTPFELDTNIATRRTEWFWLPLLVGMVMLSVSFWRGAVRIAPAEL